MSSNDGILEQVVKRIVRAQILRETLSQLPTVLSPIILEYLTWCGPFDGEFADDVQSEYIHEWISTTRNSIYAPNCRRSGGEALIPTKLPSILDFNNMFTDSKTLNFPTIPAITGVQISEQVKQLVKTVSNYHLYELWVEIKVTGGSANFAITSLSNWQAFGEIDEVQSEERDYRIESFLFYPYTPTGAQHFFMPYEPIEEDYTVDTCGAEEDDLKQSEPTDTHFMRYCYIYTYLLF